MNKYVNKTNTIIGFLIVIFIFVEFMAKRELIKDEIELSLMNMKSLANLFDKLTMTQDINKGIKEDVKLVTIENFYEDESFERFSEKHVKIISHYIRQLAYFDKVAEHGLILPRYKTVINHKPYKTKINNVPFDLLCEKLSICTKRFLEEGYLTDHTTHFSNPYLIRGQSNIMLYKHVGGSEFGPLIYWFKFKYNPGNFLSNYHVVFSEYNEFSGYKYRIYKKIKKSNLDYFTIPVIDSFEHNNDKLSYNADLGILDIFDRYILLKVIIVLGFGVTVSIVTTRKRLQMNKISSMNMMIYKDSLTGLLNRKSFDSYAANICKNENFTIFSIDGNKVKYFNDKYGHKVGDEVIKAIGRAIKNCFPNEDKLFRIGGDEFVVVMTGLYEEVEISEIIERLTDILSKTLILKGEGISVSCGVAHSSECFDFQSTLRLSDNRMYQNKHDLYN